MCSDVCSDVRGSGSDHVGVQVSSDESMIYLVVDGTFGRSSCSSASTETVEHSKPELDLRVWLFCNGVFMFRHRILWSSI